MARQCVCVHKKLPQFYRYDRVIFRECSYKPSGGSVNGKKMAAWKEQRYQVAFLHLLTGEWIWVALLLLL